MISVSVKKHGSESTPSLIRRFTKKVQGSGVVRRAKSNRFHVRTVSKNKRREAALRRLARQKKREELELLGLIQPRGRGRGRRR
ncbi:MAG: 30S ribosomal protein S21 [Candidatus Paceibacteria bacterium]